MERYNNKRLNLALEHANNRIKEFGKSGVLNKLVSGLIKFSAAIVLSQAVIFNEYAPFGVAFAAAFSGLAGSFLIAAGAIIGYMFIPAGVDGMKYAAAVILCFAGGMVFRNSSVSKYRFFIPFTAMTAMACVGFVFIAESGFLYHETLLFLCEVLLTGCSVYFYSAAITDKMQKGQGEDFLPDRMIGIMFLAVTVLISLNRIDLFDMVSPARCAAVLIVMSVSYYGGIGAGAASGLMIGGAMDISLSSQPFFTIAYSFAGIISGMLSKKKKIVFVITFVMANAVSSFWGLKNMAYLAALFEAFIASLFFIMIPEKFFNNLKSLFGVKQASYTDYAKKVRTFTGKKIKDAANAFHDLYISMTYGGFDNQKNRNDEDIAAIFDRAADKVCCGCPVNNTCWERNYVTTFNALNDASILIMKRGKAENEDFPNHFALRCIYFDKFVSAVNEALTILLQRRQYRKKLNDNKNMISEQYSSISGILKKVADEVEAAPEFMPKIEAVVKRYAENFCPVDDVSVYLNQSGRLHIELDGEDLSEIVAEMRQFLNGLSKVVGRNFCEPEQIFNQDKWKLLIKESEIYAAKIGVGLKKKHNEKISGDSGTYFKTDDGKVYMILSDGMGSGREAALESATTTKLLERFLRAGISPLETVKTVNPALKLKNEARSFATVDILGIDLFTGNCETLKYGAAPTYIRKGKTVSRITSNSFPALSDPCNIITADVVSIQLKPGDIAVMVSDGVCDQNEDEWLKNTILSFDSPDIKDLALKIINRASCTEADDDMTVLAIKLENK